MTRRISSAVLAVATVLLLVSGFAALPRADAASCPPASGNVANGKALYHGLGCINPSGCSLKCADCHGDNPGAPCGPQSVAFPEICYPCPHPNDATKGTNLALYGARKAILEGFVNGSEGMAPALTAAQVSQMFQDLGITTEAALNDLAAFLAAADPRPYTIKGTITRGLIPIEVPPFSVEVCSIYNPSTTAGPFAFSSPQFNTQKLTYEVTGLRPGEYAVLPEPPSPFFGFEPPGRLLDISFLATGISGCVPPDCTLPPVCSTDVKPVDFEVHFPPLGDLHILDAEITFCKICPPEVLSKLVKTIDQAIRQLDKGHLRPAVNALRHFVRHTEHFMDKGQLPTAEGQSFIAAAEAIIGQIEGVVVTR